VNVFGYCLSIGRRLLNGLEKMLLVATQSCEPIEKCLMLAGCKIVRALDGEEAVSQTLRHVFDAAVLVSTGPKMDLVETAFNLRDIRGSMDILIITGVAPAAEGAGEEEALAHSVPNTKVLTVKELEDLLDSHRARPGTVKIT
jgi:DNA-binding NtrC family response regulator